MCVYQHEFMCVICMPEDMKVRRGHQASWNYSLSQVGTATWVQETKLRFSGTEVNTSSAEPSLQPPKHLLYSGKVNHISDYNMGFELLLDIVYIINYLSRQHCNYMI